MIRLALTAIALLSIAGSAAAASAPRASEMEPATGTIATGVSVLVDDGTCPAGQIKQVTGGDTKRGVARTRRCVRR